MTTNKIENLSKDELEKKHQKMEDVFKGVSLAFTIIALIGVGYAGYASAKGYESPFSSLSNIIPLFAGLTVVSYMYLSKIKKEISKRENSNQP